MSGVPEPVAYLYTLEYGGIIANKKVSLWQLNYPFGVCGADYLPQNEDGISYVRQTPLYTAALRGEVKPAESTNQQQGEAK